MRALFAFATLVSAVGCNPQPSTSGEKSKTHAKAANKGVTYEQLETLADDLVQSEKITLRPPRLEFKFGQEQDLVVLYPGKVVSEDLTTDVRTRLYRECTEYVLMHRHHESIVGDCKPLEKPLADEEKAIRSLLDVANNESFSDKEREERAAKIDFGNLTLAIRKHVIGKGMKFAVAAEQQRIEVTLKTDPPNGKICMLSVLEFELFKLRKLDAEKELAQSVIAKTDPAALAGAYYYRIYWRDGKSSEIGKVSVNKTGTLTLR